MPSTGGVADSTIISMRPIEVISTSRQPSAGVTTTTTTLPDDREVFKVLHDCVKDVGKFRQYVYYIGTSCDTTKLRNKIQKLKERLNRSFYNQRELIRKGASATASIKSEMAIPRFEKCLCFTLAAVNYYEDLLLKFSILLVYFPLASGDRTNVVNLGFEDSTINAEETSYENHEAEENETNRYIELLNQIQRIQILRDEIEQIDIYQLRTHATAYSKEFVENMHKYTTDLTESDLHKNHRNHYALRHYFDEESTTSTGRCHTRCNRRKFLCSLTIVLLILVIVAVIVTVIVATNKASSDRTMSRSSSSSLSSIIIPDSSILRLLGKNYGESISLTSKYNQSLLRDSRLRSSYIVDSQTGLRQENSSSLYQASTRRTLHRTDQICAYQRRAYRRCQTKYNPYISTLPRDQTNMKIETNNPSESFDSSEQNSMEVKDEKPVTNSSEDQVVIPSDSCPLNKSTKRRMMSLISCLNCQENFKTKTQLNTHLLKCSYKSESVGRRRHSKGESLLVSLLKQEATVENKQEIMQPNQFSSILMTQPIVSIKRNKKIDDAISIHSNDVQFQLDHNRTDFIIKNTKKTTPTKNQSLPSQTKSSPLIICTMCGEANVINDELIRCSTCKKRMHAYKCLHFQNNTIVKKMKTYPWQCIDCKKCIQCGTVEHDDELLFCDHCDRAYHMDCLDPPLSEPPPGEWYCQLCV